MKGTAWRATMASSIAVVAPRLLIITATRFAGPKLPCCRIRVSSVSVSSSAGSIRRPLHAGLAVNAEAKLHLILGQFKAGLTYGGRRSG